MITNIYIHAIVIAIYSNWTILKHIAIVIIY